MPTAHAKKDLGDDAELAAVVKALDDEWAKEGGLAGRDIAPVLLLGAERKGYFHVGIRSGALLAWSYVGPEDYFRELAAQLMRYARANGLRPNFLSLLPLEEVGGEQVTCTPFGAVQRLDDLSSFTLSGNKMNRLRYMVRRFARDADVRTEEYRPGSDAGHRRAGRRHGRRVDREQGDGQPVRLRRPRGDPHRDAARAAPDVPDPPRRRPDQRDRHHPDRVRERLPPRRRVLPEGRPAGRPRDRARARDRAALGRGRHDVQLRRELRRLDRLDRERGARRSSAASRNCARSACSARATSSSRTSSVRPTCRSSCASRPTRSARRSPMSSC